MKVLYEPASGRVLATGDVAGVHVIDVPVPDDFVSSYALGKYVMRDGEIAVAPGWTEPQTQEPAE